MTFFDGRSPRGHVWAWLLLMICTIAGLQQSGADKELAGWVMAVTFIPVGLRRLNDLNQSRWWLLLMLVPIVNLAQLAGLLFRPSLAPADNGFAPTKLDGDAADAEDAPRPKGPWRPSPWKVGVAILLALSAAGSLFGPWSPDGVGFLLLGRSLVAGLAVALMWAGFRLVHREGNAWVALGLCVAVIAVGTVLQQRHQLAQLERVRVDLQAAEVELLGHPGATVPLESRASGDFGRLEIALKAAFNRASLERAAYLQSIAATGLPRLLQPQRVAADTTGQESARILADASVVVRQYWETTAGRPDQLLDEIRQLDVNPNVKRIVLQVFEGWAQKARAEFKAEGVLEERFLTQLDATLRALRESTWAVVESPLVPGPRLIFTVQTERLDYERKLKVLLRMAESNERLAARHAELLQLVRSQLGS